MNTRIRPEKRVDLLFALAVLGLGALLQATLSPSLLGVRVNLVLLLVVVWSIWRELDEAVIWGLLGGAFLDLFSAAPFGTTVLALGVVAVLANWLSELLRRSRVLAVLLMVPVLTAVFDLLLSLILSRLGWAIDYPATVALVVLPSCLTNLLAAPVVYLVLRLASARLQSHARFAWQ